MYFWKGHFPAFEDEGFLVFEDENGNFWYVFLHIYSVYYICTNNSCWNTSLYWKTVFLFTFLICIIVKAGFTFNHAEAGFDSSFKIIFSVFFVT